MGAQHLDGGGGTFPAAANIHTRVSVVSVDLALFDAATGAIRVEPGVYRVEVGPSSRDLPLAADVSIAP